MTNDKFIIALARSDFQGRMWLVSIQIGVLDIQGSVEEHLTALKKIGITAVAVKNKKDLEKISGLIIPGGESTTIGKLMKRYGLDKEIQKRTSTRFYRPLVIWGTCAGAILLSNELGLMDIAIERNAYGRQIDSFQTEISVPVLGQRKVPAVFIRAPRIKKTSPSIRVLAEYNGEPVMVRQGRLLATMFHPELTTDMRIHRYFVSMTKQYANGSSKN